MGTTQSHILQVIGGITKCKVTDFAKILNIFRLAVVSVNIDVWSSTLRTDYFSGDGKTVFTAIYGQ